MSSRHVALASLRRYLAGVETAESTYHAVSYYYLRRVVPSKYNDKELDSITERVRPFSNGVPYEDPEDLLKWPTIERVLATLAWTAPQSKLNLPLWRGPHDRKASEAPVVYYGHHPYRRFSAEEIHEAIDAAPIQLMKHEDDLRSHFYIALRQGVIFQTRVQDGRRVFVDTDSSGNVLGVEF